MEARPLDDAFERPWSAGLFRRLVESSDDVVAILDRRGRVAYVNPAGERLLAETLGDLAARRVLRAVHPEDRARTVEAFAAWTRAGGDAPATLEHRLRHGEGVRHVMWTVQPSHDEAGALIGFAAMGRDVSDLREQQAARVRREAHFRALLRGMLDAVVTIDAYGIVLDASDSVLEIFGWKPDDLRGRNISVLMPEPHRSLHDGYLARYRETGRTWILGTTREFACVRRDGRMIHCELSVSRIDVPGEEVPFFCGSFRDITARRDAEWALAERERRFRAIFEQEFQFVGLLERDGTILEANHAALHAARLELGDVVGRSFWDTPWWPEAKDREKVRDSVLRAAGGRFVRFEIAMSSVGRGPRTVDFSLKPLFDERGRVVLLLPEGRDITDIKRAQERETAMLRAFAAIGESASVLAHEIKNPLTAVNLALRAVADQLGEDHRAALDDLVASLRKVETLMRRTLSYTRPLDLEREPCAVSRLLHQAARDARPLAEAKDVRLTVEAEEGACEDVSADPVLIAQVLTNLVHNAIEAVDDGGRVHLWCEPSRAAAARDGGVRFGVDDDGPGIPSAMREEVFRPFVTTRAAGTGLGLALTRKIVEAHDGRIVVGTSSLGGARVECVLPRRSP